jgi:hypothetical protein
MIYMCEFVSILLLSDPYLIRLFFYKRTTVIKISIKLYLTLIKNRTIASSVLNLL